MGFLSRLRGGRAQPAPENPAPKAMAAGDAGVTIVTTSDGLEAAMKSGFMEGGSNVTARNAMKTSAVYACVRIRSGTVANMPLKVMRQTGEKREDANDHPLHNVLTRQPNSWMKPAQFKRMMQSHVLLRGNAYSLKVTNYRGQVTALLPMHPDKVSVEQRDDMSIEFTYTRRDGVRVKLTQADVLHLYSLTLDGVTGVTPITYARETIGAAIAMEEHGANVFKNGARVSGILVHPKKLGPEGLNFVAASMAEFRAGGAREGKDLILEEGMTYERLAMTAEDTAWIAARTFTNADIYRFFGIPPHMAGDTEKSTSFGTGIESQTNGYLTFTAEDDLIMWEEGCTTDLLSEPNLYCRFKRQALFRSDLKTRSEAGLKEVQMGVITPNEYRKREDMDPVEGGDVRYPPPNMAKNDPADEKQAKDSQNEPQK